jgi:hypothetical protein
MSEIPVIFFHLGNSDYLPQTLAQALKYNNRVILLGDTSNQFTNDDVEHYDHVDFKDEQLEQFLKNYQHFSSNNAEFEITCIKRWFIIKNFLLRFNLESCVYLDSDIMAYSNFTEEMKKFAHLDAAVMYPENQPLYRWGASGHSSYWTISGLVDFCDFVLKSYTTEAGVKRLVEKWAHHLNCNAPGGICDMSLIHLFYNSRGPEHLGNLSTVHESSTYDDNLNSAENYKPDEYLLASGPEFKFGFDVSESREYVGLADLKYNLSDATFKEIKWEDDIPYGFNTKEDKWVRFNTLHFQGATGKIYLKHLEEGSSHCLYGLPGGPTRPMMTNPESEK